MKNALINIGPPAVESLIEILHDENTSIRLIAIEALGHIKDSHAVEPLIKTLKENDDSIRLAAIEALGLIKDARAVAPLIRILID